MIRIVILSRRIIKKSLLVFWETATSFFYRYCKRFFVKFFFGCHPKYYLKISEEKALRKSKGYFLKLKNKYKGERCFIIGNGPSLNKTNMKLLKNEYTIGLNRIYLNYENMEFEPTFYCVVNPNVIEQFAQEIDRLNSIKFIRKESKDLIKNRRNVFFVDSLWGHDFNQKFESLCWYEGWTVTYCAMQVAFYLGFKTVILIGVDHYFKETGEPNLLVTANASDSNHFHPNYFGDGVKWQYPDLARSKKSYKIAKKVYMKNGRMILDATIGGKLKLFPKVDYLSLFDKKPLDGIESTPSWHS